MVKKDDSADLIADFYRSELIDTRCAFSHSFANEGLEELRFFFATMEGFIENEKKKEISQLNEHAQKLLEDSRSKFWAYHFPYWWQTIFASRLRSSLIISLMSALEEHLSSVCKEVRIIVRGVISYDDLKGSLFERSRKFLETFGEFQKPRQRLWELVGYFYNIRNIFIHNGGILEGSVPEKRIRHLMKQVPGLSNPSMGVFEIERSFCEFTIETISEFFKELQSEVIRLCERSQTFANKTYRDREEPHSSPLPHHAAYGSVLRDSADQAESDPGKHKSE